MKERRCVSIPGWLVECLENDPEYKELTAQTGETFDVPKTVQEILKKRYREINSRNAANVNS